MIHIRTFRLKDLLLRSFILVMAVAMILFLALKPSEESTPQEVSQQEQADVLTWLGQTFFSPGSVMGAAMPVLANGAGDATTWLSAAASQTEVDSAQDTDPVSDQIKFELLDLQDQPYQAPQLNADDQPQILIYHTHTREAYKQSGDYTYKAAGSWRTLEQDKSIVRVGDELTKLLTEKGFKVIHDTTDHEPPLHTTAYTRSLATMQKYKKQYPSITVFIDLHRDGVTPATEESKRDYITINGKKTARMLCVVGTGEGKTGSGFGEKPNWKANYKLAEKVTNSLQAVNSKLAKNVRVKSGRYNMHVSDSCLVMEVGHNDNTLEEALNAVPYLADAVAGALKSS